MRHAQVASGSSRIVCPATIAFGMTAYRAAATNARRLRVSGSPGRSAASRYTSTMLSATTSCISTRPATIPIGSPRRYPKTAAGSRTSETPGGWTIVKSE